MRTLSSSSEYTVPATGARLELRLSNGSAILTVELHCITYTEKALQALQRDTETYTALVPLRAARRYGLEALLAAHIAAYTAYTRGLAIAKRPGVDTLLYLAGTRNIAEALRKLAPRPGETTLALCTPTPSQRLHAETSHQECRLPHSPPEAVTQAALAPLELRAYKPQEAIHVLRSRYPAERAKAEQPEKTRPGENKALKG